MSKHDFYLCLFFLDHTLDIIERAKDIKSEGTTGAYSKEFDEMQSQLDEIEQLLNNTDEVDTDSIEAELQELGDRINKTENEKLIKLDDQLDDNKQVILLKEVKLNSLNDTLNDLKRKINDLRNNGTKLQEANVQGALTLINNAKEKADRAAQKANNSQVWCNLNKSCTSFLTFLITGRRQIC